MLRRCFWLLLTVPLAIAPWQAARTQPKPSPQATAHETTSPPAATPFGALTPDQARIALDTLNDPKKRAAFAATLEALVKAQPAAEPTPPPPPPAEPAAETAAKPAPEGIAIQLAPDSLGAQLLLSASAFLSDAANDLPRALQTMQSLPLLWGWVVVMLTNPLGQQLLIDAGWRLAVTLVLALGVAHALRILLRRPMARVISLGRPETPEEEDEDPEARAERGAIEPPRQRGGEGTGRRIGLGLARFALRMLPVLGLLIAGHMVTASGLGGPQGSRLVILAVLDAIAGSQTLLAVTTLLFMPDPPGLRLLPLRPATGAYLMRWARRLILIAVPGYTIGEVALLLGLSPPAHQALQKVVGLALLVCLAVIVVQRRREVRRWLSARAGATGVLPMFRNVLARYWYWIALFFLAASWLSWTLRAPGAIGRTLWYFVGTAAVVLAAAIARMAVMAMLGPIQPGAEGAAPAPMHPARARLTAYHPALRQLATLAINVIALLGLLQLYGLGGLSWLLTSDLGQRLASGLGTLVVTIGLAFAVWEAVNLAIQLHLETLRREAQAARSARLRTLLPLIRTTLAITVAVVAGLMVLSEIGVNIAPLLAGAGIVGVAIGFGSQKLVQDVITGVFLLLENTMQVGDVVKVGDQAGVVESLSVRTIRLRTEDGSVVVIPFSAVTTVINMTRDYSRAVIAVNIAAGEDVDRVIDTMRAIVRGMREEEAWSAIILDDLEVFGLDRITDTALQIKCRIMCTPFGRWPVGREFNRRLKGRFEMVGIATPFSALRLLSAEPVAPEAASLPSGEAMARR
jgi:small-conductance mechanosensitive channel